MNYTWAISVLPFNPTYGTNPVPRLYHLVTIEDRNVWGVDLETNQLKIINDIVNDGSVRKYEVHVYQTEAEANDVIATLAFERREQIRVEAERYAGAVANAQRVLA